jgi:hypothetical protein
MAIVPTTGFRRGLVKGMSPVFEEITMFTGRWIKRTLLLTAVTMLLAAGPAHAQRGCSQQQRQLRPMATQSQFSTFPLAYARQQAMLPQYAFQQSALQSYALQSYGLQAQLALTQRNVFLAQMNPADLVTALRDQLDALQQLILNGEQSGQLTRSQVQALRKQEKALTKQLRAAEKRVAASQKKRTQQSASAMIDD